MPILNSLLIVMWSKFLRLLKQSATSTNTREEKSSPAKAPSNDSQTQFLSSTMAINGDAADYGNQSKHDDLGPSVPTRPKHNEDLRRKSESFLSSSRKICSKKRMVSPYNSKSSSAVSNAVPEEPNVPTRPLRCRPILRRSFGQRFSEVDSSSKLRVSWRISTVEHEMPEDYVPEYYNNKDFCKKCSVGIQSDNNHYENSMSSFDIKFNQQAFLSALASINERSGRSSFVTVDAV